MGWLNLLAAACGVTMLCARFRRRFEEVAPLVLCLMMPVLLVFAMLGCLSAIDWLAAAGVLFSAGWLVWGVKRKALTPATVWRFMRQYLLTPGLLCFALLAAFFAYATSAWHLNHIDEYNYWGTIVRSLWVSDGLVDGLRSCTYDFCSYPPGMALVEWWTMHALGRWSEPTLYFSLFFANAVLLLPLMRCKKSWLTVPVFCGLAVALPSVFSSVVYYMLAVDGTLGFLFGYALYWLSRERGRDGFAALCATAAYAALALTKQSGVIWVVLALGYDLCVARRRGEKARKRLWTLAAPVACLAGWAVFCRLRGLQTYLIGYGESELSQWLAGSFALPEKFWLLAGGVLRQLATSPVSTVGWKGLTALWGLPPLGWLAVFAAVAFWCEGRKGYAVRIAAYFAAVYALYYVIMMLSYITIFAYEFDNHLKQALGNGAQDRYWIPVYFGCAYLCCDMLSRRVDALRLSGRRGRAAWLAAGLVVATLTLSNWNLLKCFYPPYYENHFPPNFDAEERREQAWVQAIDDPKNARVLVSSNYLYYFDTFSLPPVSLVKYGGWMKNDMTSEQFYDRLEAMGVTHVYVYAQDDFLIEQMASRLDFAPTPGCLYQIDRAVKPYRLVALTDAEGARLP